jgi:hypothetical protein
MLTQARHDYVVGLAAAGDDRGVKTLERLESEMGSHRDLAADAFRLVARHPALELARPVSLDTVLFRYTGDPTCGPTQLDRLNDAIRWSLMRTGRAVLGRARLDGRVFLKLPLKDAATTADDLGDLLALVAITGWYLNPSG